MSNGLPEWWSAAEQYSARAGVDSEVLRRIGGVESNFRNVDNQSGPGGRPSSSATGPFQIISGTWNGITKQNPELFSDATDRRNPWHQAKVAPFLLRQKNEFIKRRIGRDPTPGEQYLGWFSGESDAAKALLADPNAPASAVFAPGSIQANPTVFKPGSTVGDIIAWADRKMGSTSPKDGTERRGAGPTFTTGDRVSPAMAEPREAFTRNDERRIARASEEDAYSTSEGALRAIWQENGINWLSRYFGGEDGDPNWSFDPKQVPDWVPRTNLDYVGQAVSQGDFDARLNSLQHDLEVERRLSAMGGKGIAFRVVGAILDPVGIAAGAIAFPLAGAVKGGRLAQIGAGALAGATTGFVAEVPQALQKPVWSSDHMMYSVAGGALIGGALTGIFAARPRGDLGDDMASIQRGIETLHRDAGRAIEEAGSTAGSMATPRRVQPTRTDTSEFEGAPVRQEYEGSVFSKIRYDATNQLKKSDIELLRVLGHHLAVDGVGRADPFKAVHRAATIEQSRLYRRMDTLFMRQYGSSVDDYLKRNAVKWTERSNALEDFNREVTRAIRSTDPAEQFDPAILKIRNQWGDMMAQYQRLANGMHEMDASIRRAIPGFETIVPNPNYVPRFVDVNRFANLEGRLGTKGLERLITRAVLDSNPTIPGKTAVRIGRGYVRRLKGVRAGQDDAFQRRISQADTVGIRALLDDIGISGDELEWALKRMESKDTKAGGPARGKARTLFNENYEDVIGGVKVRIDEMFDNDILRIHRRYNREMSGVIALQRMRIENPRWREGDGPEVPRYLVDGVVSEGEWTKLISQIKAIGTDRNINTDAAVRTLDFLYKSIMGRALDDNRVYDQVGRILRNVNFARLMGQVAFAQVQDLPNLVGTVGFRTAARSIPSMRSFIRRAKDGRLLDDDAAALDDLGIGNDFLRGRGGMAMDDFGNVAGTQNLLDRLEHFTHNAGRFTGVASGMTGIMTFIQRWAVQATLNAFAREAAGKSGITAKRLAVLGIDQRMSARITAEIQKGWERTGGPGKKGQIAERMDLNNWNPEVRNAFEYALFESSRRIALEGDPGMTRLLMSKTTGKLLTQFRSFAINGWTQSTLHNVHMRDARGFGAIIVASFMAGMTWVGLANLRSVGMEAERKREYLEKNLSWDRVMLAGIGRTAFSSLMPMLIDTTLGVLGQDTLFDGFRTTGNSTGFFDLERQSPTGDLAARLVRLMGAFTDGEFTQAEFRNAFGIVFLQNLLPIAWLANMGQQALPK